MQFTVSRSLCLLLGLVFIPLFLQPAWGQINTANQLARTTQSLTSAAQMRETTRMLMQPYANWEGYLTPAPLSIAIMGELVFISSGTDFSINKNPPADGYKHIRYPESFRACLMQICNSGWHAFNKAHVNMDQIRIHTATVPNYMKAALNTLFRGSDAVIQTILPNQLETIRAVADDCVALSDGVKNKYIDVINLIQELLEACINAQHFYGEELEQVKLRLKAAKLREESAKRMNERSKKAMAAMEKQLDEAHRSFKGAMESMPTGWEMIAMDFVEGLSSAFTGVLNLANPSTWKGSDKEPSSSQENPPENVDEFTQMSVFSKSEEILSLIRSLTQHVSGNQIDWRKLYDQEKHRPKTYWTENQFQRIINEVENMPQGKISKELLSISRDGLNICKELATFSPNQTWDQAQTDQVIGRINNLNRQGFTFDSKSKKALNSPALAPKPPMMYKQSTSNTASKRAAENARFKIEQSREQIKQTQEAYEKSVENMEKNQKELTEILVEMQGLNVKEIDFETTVKMLVKGLDAMGRVKEQWEKMVQFFQMVSNIVKISLSKTMHNFAKTSDDTKKLAYNDKLFTKDLLYKQAFEASNIASLVHMISTTYTEVSTRYLMDRVSSLGRLMVMDKQKPEFDHERLSLKESCKDAQDGIKQLVLQRKEEFQRQTDARVAKIEGDLMAVLPAALPQETEKIKQIVQAGFSDNDFEGFI